MITHVVWGPIGDGSAGFAAHLGLNGGLGSICASSVGKKPAMRMRLCA
jgi:hypothetical protein